MAEDKEEKLGPNVTYVPEDEGDKKPVTTQGISFTPGKAVNVEERLGKEEAQRVLKKLSGNRFFKVDGGTDWQKAAEAKAKAEEEDARDAEEARKAEEEKAAKAQGQAPQPPEDWKGPDEASLESDSAARRPTMSRKDK